MNNCEVLKEKIQELTIQFVKSCVGDENINHLTPDEMLQIIITDSVQALNYIVLLEDEFELEIDDEDISLSLFQSINNVCNVINKHR